MTENLYQSIMKYLKWRRKIDGNAKNLFLDAKGRPLNSKSVGEILGSAWEEFWKSEMKGKPKQFTTTKARDFAQSILRKQNDGSTLSLFNKGLQHT